MARSKRKEQTPDDKKSEIIIVCEQNSDPAAECGENGAPGKSEYWEKLKKTLEKDFTVTGLIRSGSQVLEMIAKRRPAAIIVSGTLRDIDALTFIRMLRENISYSACTYFLACEKPGKAAASICAAGFVDGIISTSAPAEEAALLIIEKCIEKTESSDEAALERLRSLIEAPIYFMSRFDGKSDLYSICDSVMQPLGFDPDHNGTKYLKTIISLRVLGMNAELRTFYSFIAESNDTSPAAAEKAIRYSIESAWSKGSPFMQQKFFGNSIDASKGKPTNKEFIETVVRCISESVILPY